MAKTSGQFRFRKHDRIGANAAEQDEGYLDECFVETDDFRVLRDFDDQRSIVLGRTGTGKTALLHQLKVGEHEVLEVSPDSLSLNYIGTNKTIRLLEEAGVRLDVFYKLLWRHVFAVELLRHRFRITDDQTRKNFINGILSRWSQGTEHRRKKKAIEYLERFGNTFWESTEYRTKEVTRRFEEEVTKSFGGEIAAKLGPATMHVGGQRGNVNTVSEEQKIDVTDRAQDVVNTIQIRELEDIITLTDEVLDDQQKRYFITIDRLDESWAEDGVRLRLIRALIDTVQNFNRQIRNAKIVVSMRVDLLDRVFRLERGPGFQEEKIRGVDLPISWTREDLIRVVDRRIDKLVRDRYTTAKVTHRDLLPSGKLKSNKRQLSAIDFIIERTWLRPRDLIEFFNTVISRASAKATINKTMLLAAEGDYSRLRFRSIADEWHGQYPYLADVAQILKGKPPTFAALEISDNEICNFCLDFATKFGDVDGLLAVQALQVAEGNCTPSSFRKTALHTFYRTGICGLKTEPTLEPSWLHLQGALITAAEVDDAWTVAIHPGLWRVLGIRLYI